MAGNARSGLRPDPQSARSLRKQLRVLRGIGQRNAPLKRGMPPVPDELLPDTLAVIFFNRIGQHLVAHGLMAHEYTDALATLAVVSAMHVRLCEQFAKLKHQAFITRGVGKNAKLVEIPMLRRLGELSMLRMKLLAQFGLTPLSASQVFSAEEAATEPSKWQKLAGPR